MQYTKRWQLAEYGSPYDLAGEISRYTNYAKDDVHELLERTGRRIQGSLGLSISPLIKSDEGIRFLGVAGLVRIAPGLELEISPKFLGLDESNEGWREDFFFIATLSRYGRLLSSERMNASAGTPGDLHTLVARAITGMYWSNHRRPLRNYRLRNFSDYSMDGDVEFDSMLNPDSDGFLQTEVVYDRANRFNSAILFSAMELLPNLRDPSTIAHLERMISALSPQTPPGKNVQRRNLPNRAKRWQPLYELSIDVLKGLGISYQLGSAIAPGYIFDTWRVWEDLLGTGLRLGFGDNSVKIQHPSMLGVKEKISMGVPVRHSNIMVTPDFMISGWPDNPSGFLIDAKYKGNAEDGKLRISEADLYEAISFSRATSNNKIILAYPSLTKNSSVLGEVVVFEKLQVGDVVVFGVEVQTKGIAQKSGLMKFANRCAKDFRNISVT